MQFIDQSATYSQKAITLAKAIESGRATVMADADAHKLSLCFRPELEVANAFDASIDARLRFFELSTPEKLDLFIDELLPGFYHADLLPLTGRSRWTARFLIDGDVTRSLLMDAEGIRAIDPDTGPAPAFEMETDIVTLLAMLRAVIADFHLNTPDFPPAGSASQTPDEPETIIDG